MFMAKRILIFEDRPGSVVQISSNQFHYYSVLEFPEIVSFIYSQEIDLLIINGKSSLGYYSKILELKEAKSNNNFPLAICLLEEDIESQSALEFLDPSIPIFGPPKTESEWNNVSRLIINHFQNLKNSFSGLKDELSLLDKKNARLERELSTRYLIDHEKILDIQKLVQGLEDVEELNEEIEIQLSRIKNSLSRLVRLDKTWKKFVQHFEKVCPSFIKILIKRHPDLSQNDLKLGIFLKIGITNKEISIATNINEGSVRKSLNRMKKKMSLGIEDDLRFYIQMLED